jgi:phospholipid/cholesterol/gamma-HCH transport system permease protein
MAVVPASASTPQPQAGPGSGLAPTQLIPPPTPIHRLGEQVFDVLSDIGGLAQFAGLTFSWMFRRVSRWAVLVPNFYAIGVSSVPVVAITGTFIGMVLAIQTYSQFEAMGLATRLGSVINISLLKELGPVLAATMLAGRVGSSMAAELGTMRVTEQIDALSALGTNPIYYLVVPRFLACVVMIPLLTLLADFMGVIGGAVVCTKLLGVDSYHYWLHSREYVDGLDIFAGIFKVFFFGAAIALISCHRGFHSKAGAEGVGRAATEAFVYSFIAILVIDFVIGYLWNRVYDMLHPNAVGGFI